MKDEQFNTIMKELGGINERLDKQQEELGVINERLDKQQEELGVINERLDKQQEEIGGIKGELKGINKRLNRIEEETKELKRAQQFTIEEQIKGFDRLEKKINKAIFANERNQTMIMREVNYNYEDLKDENEEIRADLNALHFLSKENKEQHKEYDKLLSVNKA